MVTIEGAFYNFDYDDAAGTGTGFSIYAGYLIEGEILGGQLQPHVRLQSFDNDAAYTGPFAVATNVDTEKTDVGVNLILDGHKARISVVYSTIAGTTESAPGTADTHNTVHQLLVGTQVMF